MAKRKTKKQKQALAKKRRKVVKNKPAMAAKKSKKEDNLINYDQKLIKKDLTKTLISTLVVMGILVALFYQL